MSQPPAVVIIARHGTRFDAAHSLWHMSTPTPYDPPLTYTGWNHCRALGVRIASLLHEREKAYNDATAAEAESHPGLHRRPRRKKHKIVMHTSPFLRCLETSVAIAAGMAQFEAPKEPISRPGSSARPRTPGQLHSASPRLRAMDGSASPNLAPLTPITEPRLDFAHNLARRVLEIKRHRKAKVRVDSFLGEWLNPSYFEDITPPPPSAMMVATAKSELLQQENIDLFVPAVTNKSSASSLWSGASSRANSFNDTREGALSDWAEVTDTLPSIRRERTNSMSSVGSNDSSNGRKSPFRSGSGLQPLTSTIPKPEASVYHPPTPAYAVSGSDHIPRGYVAHARNACTSVDIQWDSGRPPLDWGTGGEYGEEWSSMQRRFRKGLNNLIYWYSQHNSDDRAEDALGFDQAERHHHDEEDQEDLVVIMVTHGAGCNALIGGLTGQPVLLDVGMASLTMAVRRENAPPLNISGAADSFAWHASSEEAEANGHFRGNVPMDIGLSAVYEMKLVSSSEHLRPGSNPTKAPGSLVPSDSRLVRPPPNRRSVSHEVTMPSLPEPLLRNNNTSAALGSIRRPSLTNGVAVVSAPNTRIATPKSSHGYNTAPSFGDQSTAPPPTFTTGLWTPPARLTPQLGAQQPKTHLEPSWSQLNGESIAPYDFGQQTPDSDLVDQTGGAPRISVDGTVEPKKHDSLLSDGDHDVGEYHPIADDPPPSLKRGLSQSGLWGKPPSDKIVRVIAQERKRRWSHLHEQQV